jgi:UDP-glucose:(heptosyl)LPS alpha-1,3-glucosyltransferase
MKIALSFPGCNRRGGIERVIYECACYLARKGHEVTVYASDFERNGSSLIYRRVELPPGPKFLRPVSYFRECSRLLKQEAYDAHGAFGCVSPVGGVYWAGSVHAAWLEKAKAFRPPWSLARWKQRLNPTHPILLGLEKRHFRKGGYRKIIALTDDVKADLQYHYGVPAEDIVVIPNGYAPEEFNLARAQKERESARREYGFTDSERVIVFVANELERKGFPALLRAVESLGDPGLRILVAGRIAPPQHALVKYIGITGNVARCYAAADVFALPTQYEAWGLVIVEALACGLPVLTTRLAGAAVTVREGVTGELLEDAKGITQIAAKLRRLLDGNHAPKEQIASSVAGYAWSEVLVKYEQLLYETKSFQGRMASKDTEVSLR